MLLAISVFVLGIIILIWSADRFVAGAAVTARYAGMSPLLIGMMILGFGTSMPEVMISTMASLDNNPGLALGNAYGSNITNIALILGIVALVKPITVHSQILRKELPLLLLVTLVAGWQLLDGEVSRLDAAILLLMFGTLAVWLVWQSRNKGNVSDSLSTDMEHELQDQPQMTFALAIFWVLFGLVLLLISSRMLVYGAVEIAQYFGVSDLVIGLTIVATFTSAPELASSLMAIKKGEHDIALGNIIGSNLFNALVVVGVAASARPLAVDPILLYRDWPVMAAVTILLLIFCYGHKKQGTINRLEGSLLLAVFIAYTGYLFSTVI